MQWLKDYHGKWTTANNYIKLSDYLQQLRPVEKLNLVIPPSKKPVIYIPTHNIHDVYEWFRICGNAHVNDQSGNPQTTNFDKFGHWIHAYFDKERCESIRDFFPNLIEVKAASSDELIYNNDERYSVDFVDTLAAFTNLFIDGVEVFDTERILLKNQYYETIITDIVSPNNSTTTSIATLYYPNAENIYIAGSSVRIQDVSGTWYTRNVTNNVIIGLYLFIDIDVAITEQLTDIGSIENGNWIKTSQEIDNGVYTFDNGSLVRLPAMDDKYKTYNQIIYCYQGLTQENNEYYLRRVDNTIDPNFTFYPWDSMPFNNGFIYSKGEAFLIKAEFDYNLDLLDPPHPVSPPFNPTGSEECFRLLFLDYDIARKVMLKDQFGLGKYESASVNLGAGFWADGAGSGTPFFHLTFNPFDASANPNVVKEWLDQDYYECFALTGVQPTLTFRSIPQFNPFEVYYKSLFSNFDTIAYVQNVNTTTINVAYAGFSYPYLSTQIDVLNPGDLIHLQWLSVDNVVFAPHDFLEDNFVVISSTLTPAGFSIEIFPKLDDNIINELNSHAFNPYYFFNVDLINVYGKFTILTPPDYDADDEAQLLLTAIYKTHLKDIYQLDFDVTSYPYTSVNTISQFDIPLLAGNIDTTYYNPPIGLPQIIWNLVQDIRFSTSVGFLPIGELIIIANQSDPTLNGVYEWRGISTPMVKKNYTQGSQFHVEGGTYIFTNWSINYTDNPSGPTFPQYVNFNNTGNVETILTVLDVKQSHDEKWFNHAIQLAYNQFTPVYADFNNAFVSIGDTYGQEYSSSNYLTNYLQITNNPPNFPALDIAQMASVSVLYDNSPPPTNNPTRIGFERNKIFFGLNYKEQFLDNIKRHTWIDITPSVAIATTDVFVSEVYWDEELELGTIELYYQFLNSQIPGLGEIVTITPLKPLNLISGKLNDTNLPITYRDIGNKWHVRPDSGSYAHALMNYVYETSTFTPKDALLNNITAIWFKELGEPRLSLRKRDKRWSFDNDGLIEVAAASTGADVNIASPPPTLDTYALSAGDLVVLQDQTIPEENGVYVYNTSPISLVRFSPFDDIIHWVVQNGATNINKIYKANFFNPILLNNALVYGVTIISFDELPYSTKKDNRMILKPIEIAKLGVDNKTQPWQKISMKYDSIEPQENLLNIEIGINNRRRIRFIDGLTEQKILNNTTGQGQYDWILDDNVIALDAVVGCTQDNGPGTGTLIWYTGIWSDGVWVDGIWMQGTWENGTWLNGTHNAYQIQDFWYYVIVNTISQVDNISIWKTGIWNNGLWNGGNWNDGTWNDGTWTDGTWDDGLWFIGNHYDGQWKKGTWENGIWFGGDFDKGEWKKGIFGETAGALYPIGAPRFGVNAISSGFENHAIWRNGTFKSGDWMSGINIINGVQQPSTDHRAAIWFAGEFQFGTWWGGSFVTGYWNNGFWKDGVWFGGYYATIVDVLASNTTKQLNINPNQYFSLLNIPNINHNLHTYGQSAHFITGITTGFPITPAPTFVQSGFANMFEYYNVPTAVYIPKTVDVTRPNDATTLFLIFQTTVSVIGISYQTENIVTGDVKGDPLVCAVWNNGTWENGVWMNGYWNNGVWKRGTWANGYWKDGTFGEL